MRQLLHKNDPHYPNLLKKINEMPESLWLEGDFSIFDTPCVAMVGAREATSYGLNVSRRLARALAQQGITVVSGMAHGIDTEAHEGALEVNGKTIAVLGHGLNVPLSRAREQLRSKIISHGLVLSEFDLDLPGSKWTFPRRNRIISGLSLGVVVVEAGLKSGSLITATWALEQNREVFAVPGAFDSPMSQGTHKLIQQGAKLVTSVEDILTELRLSPKEPSQVFPRLKVTHPILRHLQSGPLCVDELVAKCEMGLEELSRELFELEIDGKVRSLAGGRYEGMN